MALKIIWTPKADAGLDSVLEHLEENWTTLEILSLEQNIKTLLNIISEFPEIFPKSNLYKNLHKGLVDKNNYIIYRVNYKNKNIEIINFRGTKQFPVSF